MAYSVNLLTTPADCDALLALVQKDRESLVFRQTSLQRQLAVSTGTSEDVQAELQAVNAKLQAANLVLGVLPEGEDKREQQTKKLRLELRQRLLNERLIDNSPVTRLDREYDLARLGAELVETDAFIAAIQARKAAL